MADPMDSGASAPAGKDLEVLVSKIQRLLERVRSSVGADAATVLLYDWDADVFDLPVESGLLDPATFSDRNLMPGSDRLAGRIVREREYLFVDKVEGHPYLDGPFSRREKLASTAALPLICERAGDERQVVGVLFANFRSPHAFPPEEKKILNEIAFEMADMIRRADPFEALAVQRIPPGSDTAHALRRIARLACCLINRPIAIWLPTQSGDGLEIRAATGLTHEFLTQAAMHHGDGSLVDQVFVSGSAKESQELGKAMNRRLAEAASRAGWRSILALPIRRQHEKVGVLQAFGLSKEPFEHHDYESLRQMAEMVGTSLESARRADEATALAELSGALGAEPDFESAMTIIVQSARKLTRAESCTLLVLDSKDQHRVLRGEQSSENPETEWTPHVPDELAEKIRDIIAAEPKDSGHVGPSFMGVRLELQGDLFGVMFAEATGSRRFGDHDLALLATVAGQASVALGWNLLLLEPWQRIESATINLARRNEILNDLCTSLEDDLKFDYCAVQLIRSDRRIIETVSASGRAREWLGRARHYLYEKSDDDADLRDIQADIVAIDPLRAELISGYDPRFDEGIFNEFDHINYERLFVPLVVARNDEGETIPKAFDSCKLTFEETITQISQPDESGDVLDPGEPLAGQRQVILFQSDREIDHVEALGTLEVAYQKRPGVVPPWPEIAQQVIRTAAQFAEKVAEARLQHVQEVIVEEARRAALADSATLHSSWNDETGRYTYEARSKGRLARFFLKDFPPRPSGLGREAVRRKKPLFIEEPEELLQLNPQMVETGIQAMAAFPIYVGDENGVLYLHYRKPHKMSDNRVRWVELLAHRAADAIRHGKSFTQGRDRSLQLRSLHKVGQYLVSNLEDKDLLKRIAWSALSTLAADVVTIYAYDARDSNFLTPPAIAGRLRHLREMSAQVYSEDAPALLIKGGEDIFVTRQQELLGHEVLSPRDRQRLRENADSFVEREGIEACAAVRLQVGPEIVGVMFVNMRRPHEFSEEEKYLVGTLASAAAIAIRNQRQMKKRFQDLAYMAHHLNGPLIALKGWLSLMRETLNNGEKVSPDLKRLGEDLEHAWALSEDVSTMFRGIHLSQISESNPEMPQFPRQIDAPARIREQWSRMILNLDRKDLDLRIVGTNDFPRIYIDETIFDIVFYNLISNIMRYAVEGSEVELCFRPRRRRFPARVEVTSWGEEIQQDEREKIFEQFYRGRMIETTGRRYGGTGLGLWSARRLMRLVGGNVWLELPAKRRPAKLREGTCSTFVVELPQDEARSATEEKDDGTDSLAG